MYNNIVGVKANWGNPHKQNFTGDTKIVQLCSKLTFLCYSLVVKHYFLNLITYLSRGSVDYWLSDIIVRVIVIVTSYDNQICLRVTLYFGWVTLIRYIRFKYWGLRWSLHYLTGMKCKFSRFWRLTLTGNMFFNECG